MVRNMKVALITLIILIILAIIAIIVIINDAASISEENVNKMIEDSVERKNEITPLSWENIKKRFYSNPLPVNNIGDPFVLKASDGKYYCYATSASDGYKVWLSDDLVNWQYAGMAFRREADSWAVSDFWAPEVVEYNGKYYMFFSAREENTKSLRIGAAVSDSPLGPFEDVLKRPLFDFGYAAIDASVFIDDDGKKYLYYSRDCSENIVNGVHESHIYGIELADDMLSVTGQPVLLTQPEQRWEKMSGDAWRWNEGPIVLKRGSIYYMFYSANCYADATYSVGYATSESPLGPFKKSEQNPILKSKLYPDMTKSEPLISGPGHNSFALSPDGKELFIVYHTHTNPSLGGGNRQMNIDRIGFRDDGTVYVNGPSLSPQILPSGLGGFYNAALEAKVSASSVKPGHKAESLVDGELGFTKASTDYDWVSNGETEGAWVCLEWDDERLIDTIVLFPSFSDDRRIDEGQLIIDDGNLINNVKFDLDAEKPGASVIIHFPEIKAKSVKFVVKKASEGVQEVGLSEIYVMGKALDEK
ncbi:glycoside hydrolase family 43 protein [Pseudoclostridium thermosuccinogenes]|nr:glycoside hydrolase family 43 protein [Pseudoclostridium thermosuccinogenes]